MAKIDELVRASGGSLVQSASVRPGPVGMASLGAVAGVRDARKDGLDRGKEEWHVPLEKIEVDPDQPRDETVDADVALMAESFSLDGQINAILVYWREESGSGGMYRVWSGETRFRAAKKLGWEKIRCRIRDRPTPDEILAQQCVENLIRRQLAPIQEAKAFQTLINIHGWSITELAKRMGVSQPSVSQSLRMLALPEEVQDKVTSGDLAPVVAYHAAKLDDPAEQTEVVNRIIADKMTRDQAVDLIGERVSKSKSAKQGRGGARVRAKPIPLSTSRVIRTDDGFRLTIERRKGFDEEAVLVALKAAVAKLELEIDVKRAGREVVT